MILTPGPKMFPSSGRRPIKHVRELSDRNHQRRHNVVLRQSRAISPMGPLRKECSSHRLEESHQSQNTEQKIFLRDLPKAENTTGIHCCEG